MRPASVLLGCAVLVFAHLANALPVRIEFEAVVQGVSDLGGTAFGDSIQAQDRVTGMLVVDSAPLPSDGRTYGPGAYGIQIDFGGTILATDPRVGNAAEEYLFIIGGDDPDTHFERYFVDSANNQPFLAASSPHAAFVLANLDFPPQRTRIDELPELAAMLDEWDIARISVTGQNPQGASVGISLDIVSLEVLPEPTTAALFVVALALFRPSGKGGCISPAITPR